MEVQIGGKQMKVEVLSEKENPLLKRKEYEVRIIHDAATPRITEIREKVAASKDIGKGTVVVDSFKSKYGSREVIGAVNVYRTKERAMEIEPKHNLIKNGLIIIEESSPKKASEEPKEEAPEQKPKKEKEEKPRPKEEKPADEVKDKAPAEEAKEEKPAKEPKKEPKPKEEPKDAEAKPAKESKEEPKKEESKEKKPEGEPAKKSGKKSRKKSK